MSDAFPFPCLCWYAMHDIETCGVNSDVILSLIQGESSGPGLALVYSSQLYSSLGYSAVRFQQLSMHLPRKFQTFYFRLLFSDSTDQSRGPWRCLYRPRPHFETSYVTDASQQPLSDWFPLLDFPRSLKLCGVHLIVLDPCISDPFYAIILELYIPPPPRLKVLKFIDHNSYETLPKSTRYLCIRGIMKHEPLISIFLHKVTWCDRHVIVHLVMQAN